MKSFVDLAQRIGRDDLCQYWKERVPELQQSVEEAGWDGNWYMRAFDDDARDDLEVPDPYFGGPEGFTNVHDMVERASQGLLEHIRSEFAL
mgnify:CR=1 FL=1